MELFGPSEVADEAQVTSFLSEEAAATKFQAVYRGQKDRTKVAGLLREDIEVQRKDIELQRKVSDLAMKQKKKKPTISMKENQFVAATWQMQLEHMRDNLGWRSQRSMDIRWAIAWSFNLGILLLCCFVSVIYGLKFKEEATRQMCLTWLISWGVTFAIVEPLQVLVIACAPCWCNDDSRVGRYFFRCRVIYNEICAP